MERKSIQEVAAVLTAKSGLKKKDAERFATTLFEVVKESLLTDRIVKIKGLGTFKIIDIEARESININTGERVLIDGHDKITFTPDASMKELVNKPFSQFETVVLNDGVQFDEEPTSEEEPADDDETAAEELVVEELIAESPLAEAPAAEGPAVENPAAEELVIEKPVTELPVTKLPTVEKSVAEQPVVEDFIPAIGFMNQPADAEVPEATDETESIDEQEVTTNEPKADVDEAANEPETDVDEAADEPEAETPDEPETETTDESEAETPDEPKTEDTDEPEAATTDDSGNDNDDTEDAYPEEPSTPKTPWLLACLAACVLSFALGYYMGRSSNKGADEQPQQETATATDSLVTDSLETNTTAASTAKRDSTAADSTRIEKQPDAPAAPSASAEPSAPVAHVAAPTIPEAPASATETDKYAQMDARVRTGAYRIVGTDYEVTVRPGETLARVARRTLGPDMECYIEVYNGIKSNAELKAGQKLNIPKLQWKKKKKKTVNN